MMENWRMLWPKREDYATDEEHYAACATLAETMMAEYAASLDALIEMLEARVRTLRRGSRLGRWLRRVRE